MSFTGAMMTGFLPAPHSLHRWIYMQLFAASCRQGLHFCEGGDAWDDGCWLSECHKRRVILLFM